MIKTKEINATFETKKSDVGCITYQRMTKTLEENLNQFLESNNITKEKLIDIKFIGLVAKNWQETTALVIYCT